MKKYLPFISSLFFVCMSHSITADTIPNGDFESWSFNIWTEDPTFWTTNNSNLLAPVVVRDSDAYSGFIAMKMAYQGAFQPMASCGFPLTSHPLNIGGYLKDLLNANDFVKIIVHIYYNQQIVDSGYSAIYGGIIPYYFAFVVPISQEEVNADSCTITIECNQSFQSSVSFDDLQLDFTLGIDEAGRNRFTLFPNPCADHVIVRSESINLLPDMVEAYNILGEKQEIPFDRDSADDYIVELNTSALHSGTWIIVLSNKREQHSMLLIKE